jgi:threonylcarbamoyladenosine tRNA methylthiotransferase MtaB
VTESADQSSRHQIRKLVRHNPEAEVIVTGCLAERNRDHLIQMKGVTKVVPNLEKEHLVAALFPEEQVPEFSIKHFDSHTRAFVKVQDGCNSFCTYCIIPYVRGRSRSRPIASIIAEVKELVASGYKEVVITGINVGDFQDEKSGLADLVKAVDQVEGIERVRISSIDPDEVNEPLMDAVLNGKHTCHSLHLVLQSGSNVVLKRMNRKYTRQIFFESVEKLRKAASDFTFTTDVIVGFPGETESDFVETVDVMRRVKFAKVHMFPYSPRDRTRAALYPNRVAQEVVDRRKNEIIRLSEEIAYQLRQQYVGQTMKILTESGNQEFLMGHTDNFLTVKIPKGHFLPNQLIEARLIENAPDALIGIPT